MMKTADAWIAQMIMEQNNVLAMDLFQEMVSVPVFHILLRLNVMDTILETLIIHVITIITKLFLGVKLPLLKSITNTRGLKSLLRFTSTMYLRI